MSKFSFVVLLDYINETIEDLETLGLQIIENESDISLGYFTVQGETESINDMKNFLNGFNYI
jgi:hypothetical protein